MAVRRLPGGVTEMTGTDSLADPSNPIRSQYDIGLNPEGGYTATKKNWLLDYGVPLAVGGIFGYGALSGVGGAGAAGTAGTHAGVAGTTAGTAGTAGAVTSAGTPMAEFLAGAPALGSTAPGVMAGTSLGAGGLTGLAKTGMSKMFSKGVDPTTLILSALSLLGGPQTRKSFNGAGTADPKAALQRSLQEHYALLDQLKAEKPLQLRSSAAPPAPITVPGLGFQIGGGLGRDPAQVDPTLDPLNPTPTKLRTPNAY